MKTSISFIIVKFLLLCRLQHGTAQQRGDLRLINGTISNNIFGRLEIYDSSNDRWATICIEGFTLISANTACKQLGRARAESFGPAETMGFGIGVGNTVLTQVQCGEDDNHILRCFAMGVTGSCDHTEDVGIYCSTESAFQYEGGVRLAYGQYPSEGILEVFIFDQWYTLCTDELPASAATAVCTQLGYTNYVELNSNVRFQANATSVWRTSPSCAFSIPCFSRCYRRPPTKDDIEDDCTSDTYVHITCGFDSRLTQDNPAGQTIVCDLGPVYESLHHGDLRLENGNQYSGRLEIYDSTRGWGTICTEKFIMESANTACRQLGYARAVQFGEADELGYEEGSGPILFTDVQCDGIVNHILRCSLTEYNTILSSCDHGDDVGIICENRPALEYEGSVRLVDNQYRSEGRLEVFIFGGWYSPCTTEFTNDAADVVCRQLGYTNRIGYTIKPPESAVATWNISSPTCDSTSIYCFGSCYPRPVNMTTLRQMQSCPLLTYIYVRCDFNTSYKHLPTGNASQCYLGTYPPEPTEPPPPKPTPPGTIVGITLGVAFAVTIIVLFILHKNGKLKEMKQRWDKFVANSRTRLRSWNPRNRVRDRPTPQRSASQRPSAVYVRAVNRTSASNRDDGTTNNEEVVPPLATSNAISSAADRNATSTHDGSKPPDYQEALAYCKPPNSEEGYPEPSLVDGPQPPSYDAVY